MNGPLCSGAFLLLHSAAGAVLSASGSSSAMQAAEGGSDNRNIRNFTMEYIYKYPSNDSFEVLRIYGYEPAEGSGYPVYVHSGGLSDKFDCETPEIMYAQMMAERGYVGAVMEMPSGDFSEFVCDGHEDSLMNLSRRIFGYSGEGDTQSTALATLCRRESADCGAGIAVHGLSISGIIASIAGRYASGVTALLRWSSGVFAPYGHGTCGLFSGDFSDCSSTANFSKTVHNYTTRIGQDEYAFPRSVINGTRTTHTVGVGGLELWCAEDEALSDYLDSSRRRHINSEDDVSYGNYHCNVRGPSFPDGSPGAVVSMPDIRLCDTHLESPDAALPQLRRASGRDCGDERNCVAEDGSGYYLLEHGETGGEVNSSSQAHNWHMLFDEFDPNSGRPPQHTHGFFVNPTTRNTTLPFGLTPTFDWLAETGRRESH